MKAESTKFIVCPICKGSLSAKSTSKGAAGEITNGFLECAVCGIFFPVRDGFPDFVSVDFSKAAEKGDAYKVALANKEYHDRHADTYETDPHTNYMFFGACQKRINSVVKWARERTEGISALDIGCGTGNILKHQCDYFERVFGIDLSVSMMRLIGNTKAELLIASGSAAPFADETFDMVSAFSVLHHFYDPMDLVKEAYRLLKAGGVFYSDWDFNRFFRTRFFFSFWLHNLNPVSTFKGFWKHFIFKDERDKLFTTAEYHAFRDWLNGESIAEKIRELGFSKTYLIYHWNAESIFDKDGEPFQPPPRGIIPLVTFTRKPKVAFPIFAIIAIK